MSHLTAEQWAEVERAGKPRFRGKGSPEQALLSYWAAELLRLRAEVEYQQKVIDSLGKDARLGANLRKLVAKMGSAYVAEFVSEDAIYIDPDILDDVMEDEAKYD